MPSTGHFILHSNVLPPLTAGHYELVSEQTGLPFAVAEEHSHITVSAPRYTMPTDQILSTFPPANGEGAFGDRLPQIVLKRRTLPWERNPDETLDPSPTPWLALVVVAEGEASLSSATPVADCVTPGTKLLEPTQDKDVEQALYLAVTETVVKKIFPCEEDLPVLAHVREVDVNDTELANGDDDGWLAVVLANRLPVFDKAAGKPVRYMACLVNVEGQLKALPDPEPPEDEFVFELAQDWTVLAAIDQTIGPDPIVMGQFEVGDLVLPAPAGLHAAAPESLAAQRQATARTGAALPAVGAALDGTAGMTDARVSTQWSTAAQKVSAVALDPDAKRLVRDTMAAGFRYPIEHVALEPVLRFPVLAHWSFTTTEGATFETLMQDLDVGLLGTAAPESETPPARPAPEVVETGHVGLEQRSRRGDRVRSWYRGPCVPFPTARDRPAGGRLPLAHSADQLRRVVPDGREDLSLASAFEIGRLLGLSQLSIVSALLRFRGEQFGAGRARELLTRVTDFDLPRPGLTLEIDLGRYVALQVLDSMVKHPADTIGPRRPVADPGRELSVRGDLDELICEGLGIDLAAVREAGEQVGILASIAQAQVPIASRPGAGKLDDQALAGLHDALTGELARVAGVAAPPIKRGVRRAQRPADALDDAIARADDGEEG